MKTTKILSIIFITIFLGCAKDKDQEIIDGLLFQPIDANYDSMYKTYDYIESDQRQSLSYDDVDIHSGLWPIITSGDIISEYTSSGYLVTNTYAHDRFVSVNIENIEDQNFEIEFVMQLYYDTSNVYSGFFWGDDNVLPHKFYYYKFLNNPQAIEFGEWHGLYSSDYDNSDLSGFSINNSGFNKYTIRKINNKYYFFINEVFLFDTFTDSFFGNNIGILNGGYSSSLYSVIKIDYLVNL